MFKETRASHSLLVTEGALLGKVVELGVGLLLAGRGVAMFVDADVALPLQLEHHRLGLLDVGRHRVELGELAFGLLDVGQLGLDVGLAIGSGLLLLLDLLAGASSLARDLQHVSRDSLGHCDGEEG